MKNILIVCADKNLRQDMSKVLSRELGFLYADIDEILDYELLNSNIASIAEAGTIMTELELKSIKRALEFDKCVLTMSSGLFVSNANFRLLNMSKIFVTLPKSYLVAKFKADSRRLEQELLLYDKINKLISINCDIVVDRGAVDIEDMCYEILKKIK